MARAAAALCCSVQIREVEEGAGDMRADGERNRAAILAAARRLFAERGLGVPFDLIASEAGVSRATQNRHFPTKGSLALALFEENLNQLARVVEDAPAGDGYVAALVLCAELMRRDIGFIELFDSREAGEQARSDVAERFLALMVQPLRAAQAAGLVREDIEPEDTLMLVNMLGAAALPYDLHQPAASRGKRGTALIIEAIRPSAGRGLPDP
jgi:AcrR family transcriptional regulator